MQSEILASSELYSTFPHYDKLHTQRSIPILIVPKSKYSSTETDISSSDESYENDVFWQTNGLAPPPPLSGFSTSTTSSKGSSRKRRKRKKNRVASSSSLLNLNIRRSESNVGEHETKRADSSNYVSCITSKKSFTTKIVPPLTSVKDINHAVGRHRGISGSYAPAVDAALFAMFYLTDIFDCLLSDTLSSLSIYQPNFRPKHRHNFIIKELLSLLRKEIVYSLRINYFCPSSKIMKLMQLVEEYYPLEHIQDASGFLDLLFREMLRQHPFLSYANGDTGYIHPIDLEYYLTRKYYYQPVALTVQQLLRQKNIFHTRHQRKNSDDTWNFATVPYPALVLNVIRKTSDENLEHDESMYYWNPSTETHINSHKRPVIPNLKIDITELIGRNDRDNSHPRQSCNSNWDENISFRDNQSVMAASTTQQAATVGVDDYFTRGPTNHDLDQGVDESRFLKSLKSTWKVVFKYLEDLAVSATYVTPQETATSTLLDESNIRKQPTSSTSRPAPSSSPSSTEEKSFNPGINNHLSSSLSSLSISTSPSLYSYQPRVSDLEESFTEFVAPPPPSKVQVKMELIAIICRSRKKSGTRTNSFAGYSVYCKAGKDVIGVGENFYQHYAPWVLYESKSCTAPQVVLIENFGKWMASLEKHCETLSLYQVPMEIRRVLEDSHLFIYKRL